MHEHVRLSLSFLKTIRWWLVIQSVTVAGRVSTRAANWIGERSALNDALIACLARLALILSKGIPNCRLNEAAARRSRHCAACHGPPVATPSRPHRH
jgi:hypothetical protein